MIAGARPYDMTLLSSVSNLILQNLEFSMQLTRFDRWLREKFVYETHIHTLRPPESIPAGIRAVELPEAPGKRYKHLFIADSSKAADALIHQLKENSQMYTTQVVDRDAWFVPVHRPQGKIRHLVAASPWSSSHLRVLRPALPQGPGRRPGIPQKFHGGHRNHERLRIIRFPALQDSQLA